MPESRKRPTTNNRRRQRGPKPPLETVHGVIRVKRNIFDKLRDNEDFATLVRVGRLLNVLVHMVEIFHISPLIDEKKPLTIRSFSRNMFNTAGYVYEAYLLVESLSLKYGADPYFSKFADILKDPDKGRKKKILLKMRNAGAFHLDSDNKSTKAALSKLRVNKIELFSSGDGDIRSLYFHLADTLDLNFVIDELKKHSDDDESVIYEEIGKLPINLQSDFIFAADQFIEGLLIKLGFGH